MILVVSLLTAGTVLILAGYRGQSITDVITGKPPNSDSGNQDQTLPSPSDLGLKASKGLGVFDGHLVSDWIIPVLKWARKNGWSGHVTDGYRTFADQVIVHSTFGPKAAPGTSNHEKVNYPGGAVDVSDYQTLAQLVPHYPGPGPTLVSGAIIGDPLHFSATGH